LGELFLKPSDTIRPESTGSLTSKYCWHWSCPCFVLADRRGMHKGDSTNSIKAINDGNSATSLTFSSSLMFSVIKLISCRPTAVLATVVGSGYTGRRGPLRCPTCRSRPERGQRSPTKYVSRIRFHESRLSSGILDSL